MPFVVFYRESEPEEDFYSADWDGVPAVGETVDLPEDNTRSESAPYRPTLERFVVKSRHWADYTRHNNVSVEIIVAPVES